MKEKNNQTRLFDQPDARNKSSRFDLSYPNKLTMNFNKLVPILCKKTLPRDNWTIKTSVFSRWLAMSAPVFSEYNLRFMSAFVANQQVWAGWQQFMGLGDDQASKYLLPGSTKNFEDEDYELPYITTKAVCEWFAKKILSEPIQFSYNGSAVPLKIPVLTALGRRFFRQFYVPLMVRPANSSTTNYTSTAVTTDEDFLNSSAKPTVGWCMVLGSVRDNAYWDDMVNQGYVVEIPEQDLINAQYNSEFLTRLAFVASSTMDYVFVNYGSNQAVNQSQLDTDPAMVQIELPKFWYPVNVSGNPLSIDFYASTSGSLTSYDTCVPTKNNWYQRNITRYIPLVRDVVCPTQQVSDLSLANSMKCVWTIDTLLPSEMVTSSTVSLKINLEEIFERTLGSEIIYQLFGAGSLTDYMGKAYSNSLLRQPLDKANKLLNNYVGTFVRKGHIVQESGNYMQFGTYNEKSHKYDKGVINDVPISLLPYLAYHKVWSDYVRDNKFELRFIYSDPYKSPFMQPKYGDTDLVENMNGTYVSGNLIKYHDWGTATIQIHRWDTKLGAILYSSSANDNATLLSNPAYSDQDEIKVRLSADSPFSLDFLCQLLSLRERRVVHDFFTMVTPTSQYGGAPASAEVDLATDSVNALQLRLATRLQKFLERANFTGSDYIRQILANWGVKPQHCQHCSTQYLGGKIFTPTISPVTQTSSDNSETNQTLGQQSAQMYCSGNLGTIRVKTDEHGYIFTLVTAQNSFFSVDGQELDPTKPLDYPNPLFADLGPETLPLCRVIQTDGSSNKDHSETNPFVYFGFIPRYAQWKCSLAEIHGDFRKSLSYWVSKRQFDPDLFNGSFGCGQRGNVPQIGKNFLYENPDYSAFVYDGDEYDHALLDIDNQIYVRRELPMLPSPNVL